VRLGSSAPTHHVFHEVIHALSVNLRLDRRSDIELSFYEKNLEKSCPLSAASAMQPGEAAHRPPVIRHSGKPRVGRPSPQGLGHRSEKEPFSTSASSPRAVGNEVIVKLGFNVSILFSTTSFLR
jgi:hypothetical protein